MDTIFDPDTYLLDPSSGYDSNSFLSFSSFSDLSNPSWNDFAKDCKDPPARSDSDASSPGPIDPFEIVNASIEPPVSESDYGIFHAPGTKLSSIDERSGYLSHRSSGSLDSWGEPITPSLTTSFNQGYNSLTASSSSSAFAWDEAAPSLAGSSSYTPPAPAYRVASNPVIGANRHPRTIKNVTSMPALKEEDTMAPLFDPSEYLESLPIQVPQASGESDEGLVNEFDFVFGDYGLGAGASLPEGTLFDAFQHEPTAPIAMSHSHSHTGVFPQPSDLSYGNPPDLSSWMTGLPAAQDVVGLGHFVHPSALAPGFIDPSAVMSSTDEESSRPSSAPGLSGGEGSRGLLSVSNVHDAMTRSLSSEGLVPSRQAPLRDLFSYAPQQIPSGPPGPQPLYTSDPSPSYKSSAFPRSMPTSSRRAPANLSIQIHPPPQSTFVPSQFPPTPQSATFPTSMAAAQAAPVPMQRAGTNPLPRKSSGMPTTPVSAGLPPHLARAQAIVQQQEAHEQAQREAARREAASRRVGMAQASVMQQLPQTQQPLPLRRQQPAIMGWEGPSAQTGAMPVLTHTPLVTVHPPPASYMVTGTPISAQRVHPPPHPSTMPANRPIARLPSSPVKVRKTSSPGKPSPAKARSPSARKKNAPAPGGFSWGETTFINFTSKDAEKLLTGVAPSGSQSKRRREEEAAAALTVPGALGAPFVDDDRSRSKRSRSDE
ncbi:hypothetical protein IAU60_006523 [Kwoniella sp. DSM 27419]